jgi:hypothetical protein
MSQEEIKEEKASISDDKPEQEQSTESNQTDESEETEESEEERIQREAQELKKKVNKSVNDFLGKYFVPMETFIEEEIMFAMEAGLKEANIDYFGLRRFLTTALKTMCELDENIMSGLLDRLNKDLDNLFKYYDQFQSKNKISKIIFETDFLPKVPMYVELNKELEETRNKKSMFETKMKSAEAKIKAYDEKGKDKLNEAELKEYKMYKKQNADCVHHFAENRDKEAVLFEELQKLSDLLQNAFLPRFAQRRDAILVDLKEIINKKSYYLDKSLWYYSAESQPILKFFETSDIKGDFSLKTYLGYYLKNVDMSKSKNNEWHQYLHDIMEVLE